ASHESSSSGLTHDDGASLREQLGRKRHFAPYVPRLSGTQRSVFGNVLRISAACEPYLWRAIGESGGGTGVGNVLHRSWSEAHSGPHPHPGRRSGSSGTSSGNADL